MCPAITFPYTYSHNLSLLTPLIPQSPIFPSGISHFLAHAVHRILPI
jgi:hypothetical protein